MTGRSGLQRLRLAFGHSHKMRMVASMYIMRWAILAWLAIATPLSAAELAGRSMGCGIVHKGTGNFTLMTIRAHDQDRTFHLRLPATYDANRAYPIIFLWHGSGGDGLSGGLGIEFSSGNNAIVVGANGLEESWKNQSESSDLLFFDSMLETIAKGYCIDHKRIFSYGFSAGGYFTNLLACERGDVLRASAAIAGGPRGSNCKGKVASWFLHDVDDAAVPIANGRTARDRAIEMNGCSAVKVDEGDGCERYQGCEKTPVVWCESKGIGHDIRGDFAPARVWKFFQRLR
jgi:polyhydroxybutyrate depolymerase